MRYVSGQLGPLRGHPGAPAGGSHPPNAVLNKLGRDRARREGRDRVDKRVEPAGLIGGRCRGKTASSAEALMAPPSSVPSPAPSFGLYRRLRRWLVTELQGLHPVIEASAAGCGAEHSRTHFDSYH